MSSLLRMKQNGPSSGVCGSSYSNFPNINTLQELGINSDVSQVAYDPIQSLLAVGTYESESLSGQIYIFGSQRICFKFTLSGKASISILRICNDKAICVDSRNDLSIFSLQTKSLLSKYSPPGLVSTLLTDPGVDYTFIGLQNGLVLVYDLNQLSVVRYQIPYVGRDHNSKSRPTSVVSLELHPKDIGKLLIAYQDCTAIYSFKQGKAVQFFAYDVPGKSNGISYSCISKACFDATGTFILSVHEDGVLVFWDIKSGKQITARRITLIQSGSNSGHQITLNNVSDPLIPGKRTKVEDIAWCSNGDLSESSLLVHLTVPNASFLCTLWFGKTPAYMTSSWQTLASHFGKPKKVTFYTIQNGETVVKFCVVPRSSPYFGGGNDPRMLIEVMGSGEIILHDYTTGNSYSEANYLPVWVNFVNPFPCGFDFLMVERSQWLSMVEKRKEMEELVKGGLVKRSTSRRCEWCDIILMIHRNGIIRLFDVGDNGEVENAFTIQANVAQALARHDNINITTTSFSGKTGDLGVGLASGEVVFFSWTSCNSLLRRFEESSRKGTSRELLVNLADRIDNSVQTGLLPTFIFNGGKRSVTALKLSDTGFIAVGFDDGYVTVIDTSGPFIIFNKDMATKEVEKKPVSRKPKYENENLPYKITALEFSVMIFNEDAYSSFLLHIGTDKGMVYTFKILPDRSSENDRRYEMKLAGVCLMRDHIISIRAINTGNRKPAYATRAALSKLKDAIKIPGAIVVSTVKNGVGIFQGANGSGNIKKWNNNKDLLCILAELVEDGENFSLVAVFETGKVKQYTLPLLKEVQIMEIPASIAGQSNNCWVNMPKLLPNGNLLMSTHQPSRFLEFTGLGNSPYPTQDQRYETITLFNRDIEVPTRPTMMNLQWIGMGNALGGSMSLEELERIVGTKDVHDNKSNVISTKSVGNVENNKTGETEEGYLSYIQRQIQERTENLNILGDSVERLEETSSKWLDDVSKFAKQQKRNLITGAIKAKFGL